MNNKVEMTKIIGIIQDLAADVEQDATNFLVYKDKKMSLSEIRDGCEAILGYVAELEKMLERE